MREALLAMGAAEGARHAAAAKLAWGYAGADGAPEAAAAAAAEAEPPGSRAARPAQEGAAAAKKGRV